MPIAQWDSGQEVNLPNRLWEVPSSSSSSSGSGVVQVFVQSVRTFRIRLVGIQSQVVVWNMSCWTINFSASSVALFQWLYWFRLRVKSCKSILFVFVHMHTQMNIILRRRFCRLKIKKMAHRIYRKINKFFCKSHLDFRGSLLTANVYCLFRQAYNIARSSLSESL